MKNNKIKCLTLKAEEIKERVTNVVINVCSFLDNTGYTIKLKTTIKRVLLGIGTGLVTFNTLLPKIVYANNGIELPDIGGKIREIFNPIADMLASLGYPTAYVMLILGGLLVMTGRKAKGIEIIKWASVGYIALQLVPFLLNLLELLGKSLRGGVM